MEDKDLQISLASIESNESFYDGVPKFMQS